MTRKLLRAVWLANWTLKSCGPPSWANFLFARGPFGIARIPATVSANFLVKVRIAPLRLGGVVPSLHAGGPSRGRTSGGPWRISEQSARIAFA